MKESFILYQSFYQSTKDLPDEKKGELYDAIFQYNAGIEVRELCPVCQMAFNFMKGQFERDADKYQSVINRNRNNGAKGGRPKANPEEPKKPTGLNGNPEEPKKPTGLNGNPEEPKKADTVSDTVSDTEKKEIKKNERFSPPTLQEVKNYFSEKGYPPETGQKAFDYYNEASWKDSTGKQVKNWKQKMIAVWMRPENKQKNTDEHAVKLNLNPEWQ